MKKLLAIGTPLAALAAAVFIIASSGHSAQAAATTTNAPPEITSATAEHLALTRAAAAGDSQPSTEVGVTSLSEAAAAVQAPMAGAVAAPSTPIYFVTMRGSFVFGQAHMPKGATAPTGHVMQVMVTKSGSVVGIHVGNE